MVFLKCPECNVSVKSKNLPEHLFRVHGKGEIQANLIDKGKNKSSGRVLSSRRRVGSVQQQIQQDREWMLSNLNFDEALGGKVMEMFEFDFQGLPVGKENIIFSTAIFEIDNAEIALKRLEQLDDVELIDERENAAHFIWTRAYPKGHWNPMSTMPGARQIIGDIQVNFDNTLKLETKTKSWMIALIYLMAEILGREIRLTALEFRNPLDMLLK